MQIKIKRLTFCILFNRRPSDGAVPNVIILESKEKDTKSDDEYFVINEAPLMVIMSNIAKYRTFL
jgi:hypothetical protein